MNSDLTVSRYYALSAQLIQYNMSKNFRSNLRHWLGKVYGLSKQPKKTASKIAKKLTQVEIKQPKSMIEERIADSLFERFQELKSRRKTSQDGLALIDDFLKQNQVVINDKLQENITQHVQKYFMINDENTRNHQDYVVNVWDDNSHTYDCICPKTTKDLWISQQKQDCYRCQRSCHTNCLWTKESKQYECPMCFVLNCIPNKEVKKVLFAGFLRQIKKDKIEYKINLPLQHGINQESFIEARCVRLSKDSRYEIAWPMNSSVYLNSKKIMDFKPLNINSSLKKRSDDEIVLEKRYLSQYNTLVIEQKHQHMEGYRPIASDNHFVVIVLANPLSVDQMVAKILKEKLTIEESKQKLRQFMDRGSQDCLVGQINISMTCQLFNQKIIIPARGKNCVSHYQPFDLRSFLFANLNVKSSSQRWRCPRCKQRTYHLTVDGYLLKLIETKPKADIIEFDRSQEAKIFERQQSDNESENPCNERLPKNLQVIECQDQILNQELAIRSNPNPPSERQFVQYIEIESDADLQEVNETENRKRAFEQRGLEGVVNEIQSDSPQKKRKNEEKKNLNPLSRLIKSTQINNIDEESIHSSDIINFQSKYSSCNSSYNIQPQKKEKKERGRRKEQLFFEDENQIKDESDKMSKALVPSPAISTVIPQALRILEKRIPEVSKRLPLFPPSIQIQSQDENEQFLRDLKLKYHKEELMKQKIFLTQRTEKCEITTSDQSIFLSICQKFMTGFIKNF